MRQAQAAINLYAILFVTQNGRDFSWDPFRCGSIIIPI